MENKLSFYAALLIVVIFSPQVFAEQNNARGVVSEESYAFDGLRRTADAGLYVPRQILNGSLYAVGKTAAALSDPDFIERVEDILWIYERDLAWFPVVDYASHARFVYGGGIYYHRENVKFLSIASGYDSNYWSFDSKISYNDWVGEDS